MLFSHIYAHFNSLYFHIFTDPVAALNDIWIVGEGCLRATFASLQTLKTSAKSRQDYPYLYQQ